MVTRSDLRYRKAARTARRVENVPNVAGAAEGSGGAAAPAHGAGGDAELCHGPQGGPGSRGVHREAWGIPPGEMMRDWTRVEKALDSGHFLKVEPITGPDTIQKMGCEGQNNPGYKGVLFTDWRECRSERGVIKEFRGSKVFLWTGQTGHCVPNPQPWGTSPGAAGLQGPPRSMVHLGGGVALHRAQGGRWQAGACREESPWGHKTKIK